MILQQIHVKKEELQEQRDRECDLQQNTLIENQNLILQENKKELTEVGSASYDNKFTIKYKNSTKQPSQCLLIKQEDREDRDNQKGNNSPSDLERRSTNLIIGHKSILEDDMTQSKQKIQGGDTERILDNYTQNINSQSIHKSVGNKNRSLSHENSNKEKKIWNLKQPSMLNGDYQLKKRFLIKSEQKEFDEVHLCRGELQVDLQILKQCGDNLEYANPNLSQVRSTNVSPFTRYRTPVCVTRYNDQKYTEIALEQNKKVFNDFDNLFGQLSSISSVLAYANIQAISEHLKIQQSEDNLRLIQLNAIFKSNEGFKKKMMKLEQKLRQKEINKQQQLNQQQPPQELQERDDDSETNIEQIINDGQNAMEMISYQNLLSTLEKHKEESLKKKQFILKEYFDNQCYIYVQKDNSRTNLKTVMSNYGISREFEKIIFGQNDFSNYSLHQGLYHPYHDNYSHLQHFLVHLLNYQDRRVNLRTTENCVLQGYLRRHVITVNTTQIPNTELFFTDKIVLHQFFIDQNHLQQLVEIRKQQQQNSDYEHTIVHQEYIKQAKFFISKFQIPIDLVARKKKQDSLQKNNQLPDIPQAGFKPLLQQLDLSLSSQIQVKNEGYDKQLQQYGQHLQKEQDNCQQQFSLKQEDSQNQMLLLQKNHQDILLKTIQQQQMVQNYQPTNFKIKIEEQNPQPMCQQQLNMTTKQQPQSTTK